MRKLIQNDLSKCSGCNCCIRACPIGEANIPFFDNGRLKVRVENEKCIVCGACLAACRNNSRFYEDDTERFIADLMKGEAISVLYATAARTNLRDWDKIQAWLKSLGAKNIFDVSLGSNIGTWAYIRWIQQNKPKTIISQPCPAVVDYIRFYNPSLMPYLSPVHSPVTCAAIYMRRYQNIPHKLAAISPCIAQANEFEETGRLVSYNVTFKRLEEYIARNNIILPDDPEWHDHDQSCSGSARPSPCGLKENVEFFLGKALRVDKSEGQSIVYKVLDAFGKESPENLPTVFDLSNCPEGCNFGMGTEHAPGAHKAGMAIGKEENRALVDGDREYFEQMFADFDGSLRITDFLRRYNSRPAIN